MIHSSRRVGRTKAIAEVLAMIADAHPEIAPHHPRPVHESGEWLWESATEFCTALDRYAEQAARLNRKLLSAPASCSSPKVVEGESYGCPRPVLPAPWISKRRMTIKRRAGAQSRERLHRAFFALP